MTVEVKTHSTCDCCGDTVTRLGAENDCPPVGWARLRLSIRHEGAGWTRGESHNWDLCPRCIARVQNLLAGVVS